MKKLAGLLLITCLVLALPTLSGGCGGGDKAADTARAKEFMQTGDDWMAKVEADFQTISETRAEMMDKVAGDDARLNTDKINKIAEDVKSASEAMANSLEQAESAYNEINSLDDAKNYNDYASVMLELIAEYNKFISMQQNTQGSSQPPDLESGATPGANGNQAAPSGSSPVDPNSTINSLRQRAEAIKSERNL